MAEAADDRERRVAGGRKAHHRDTPPEDVIWSRQVSWLAGPRCCLVFPKPSGFSDISETAARRSQLRGQLRRYTEFPLSSGISYGRPENHDGRNMRQEDSSVKTI